MNDLRAKPPRVTKVLVANRGEIARRIVRTLRAMGLASVAVYSDADAGAPHVAEADEAVRVGPAPSRDSYLNPDALLAAARATGADAVHPGYGFLAENADFAARVAAAGLTFVGPPVEAIRRMGSKIEAKRIMAAAGVPVVPGVAVAGRSAKQLVQEAEQIGWPVLVKASAGGGGRGMRIVRDARALPDALAAARREAESAFGDGTLLLERWFEAPRHVEVQVFGDAHGTVVHLFERECSIQRRHQKVIEEAPSPAVDDALRRRMGEAAVAAARAIGYVGAGTVEFMLDGTGAFWFLEVNTRLQVEHPVTERVTGLDLVRLQVAVARGEPLPFAQDDLHLAGHAVEARLYAEDPARDFLPATGTVTLWEPAAVPGVRWDAGVEAGTTVGVHYDPLLAKVIAHGPTRADAVARLVRALRTLGVAGVATNRDFLVAVLEHPAFAAGALDTQFIDRHFPPAARRPRRDPAVARRHAIVAALAGHERRRRAGGPLPPSIPSGWRNNRSCPQRVAFRAGGDEIEVAYVAGPRGRFEVEAAGTPAAVLLVESGETALAVEIDGVRRRYTTAVAGETTVVHGSDGTTELLEVPRFPPPRQDELAGGCVAPMTGIVRDVRVKPGDRVTKGAVLLVLEAMKMEHTMVAHADGVVRAVRVEVGQMVDPDAVLVVLEPDA
ncbi:MAG TPA: biotin carboxylase N-terminal domain-containing protein [Candidatus Binatia bacterium]|nr:biotin carboxylase N-terminal domain-containing protein [Candidatus Binatia bacterium]